MDVSVSVFVEIELAAEFLRAEIPRLFRACVCMGGAGRKNETGSHCTLLAVLNESGSERHQRRHVIRPNDEASFKGALDRNSFALLFEVKVLGRASVEVESYRG